MSSTLTAEFPSLFLCSINEDLPSSKEKTLSSHNQSMKNDMNVVRSSISLPLPGVSSSVWSLRVRKEVPDNPPCLLSVLLDLGSHTSLQDQSIQRRATKMGKGLEGKMDEEQLKSLLCSSQNRGDRGKASWRPTASSPQENLLPFLYGILDINILAHTLLLF